MVNRIKIPIRTINIERQKKGIKSWKIPYSEKNKAISFINDLELGVVTGNQMKTSSLNDYISNLKTGLEFFNKEIKKINIDDIKKLMSAMLKDEMRWVFKKKDETGKTIKTLHTYSDSKKVKVRNTLSLYFNYLLREKSDRLTRILKTKRRLKPKTPDCLTEEEVVKLFKAVNTKEYRYMLAMTYDGGMRAEEFFNIRREDLQMPSKENNFVRVTLKAEYSKTLGRTISLYWKYSTKAVQEFLEQRIDEGIQPEEPIMKTNYRAARKYLSRLGQKILNRRVYFHLFRHSSATRYANKLSRTDLCIRFSWRFSSPMPDLYISRGNIEQRELDEKFKKVELDEIKEDLESQKRLSKITQDDLIKKNEELEKKFSEEVIKHQQEMEEIRNLIKQIKTKEN